MNKYFVLDKQYAKDGISRCIGIFDTEPSEDILNSCIEQYSASGCVIYYGEDIPHYFRYIEKDDTIEAIAATHKKPDINNNNNTTTNEEKIFDDAVLQGEGEYYFYIFRSIAEKNGVSSVRATTKQRIINTEKYFGDNDFVMAVGNNISYYVTVDGDTFREATKFERYERGQYELSPQEYCKDGEIYELKDGEYYDGNRVVKVEKVDIPIKQYWDFGNMEWCFLETELQAIDRIEDELIECKNEIDTRKEIGLGSAAAENKYNTLLDEHRIVSEIYATKKNPQS